MKISEAFDMYIQEYLLLKNGSKGTIEHYYKYKKSFCACIGDIEIEEVDLGTISKWNSCLMKGRSENTVREYLCGLRMLLRYCSLRNFPCLNYSLVPVPKRTPVIPTFLTKEEVSLMIDNACNVRAAFVISLLYSSGIRLSEMLALSPTLNVASVCGEVTVIWRVILYSAWPSTQVPTLTGVLRVYVV